MRVLLKKYGSNVAGILLVLSAILLSCTKDISVKIPHAPEKIVIEGIIENGQYPWVIVTRNADFFEAVDSSTLLNMVVLDALVTVTDGSITDTLSFELDQNQVPFYKYVGSTLIGEIGKTYRLTVKADGKTFTAQTSIPNPVQLDSLVFKNTEEVKNDSAGFIWFYFQDPDTLGNYYRAFTKTIGKDSVFVHASSSVTDDRNVNGQYIEFPTYRGWNPNLTEEQHEAERDSLNGMPRWAFVRGDVVVFKFCSLDSEHYEFWRTIEVQNSSDGNPFASPTTVYTNISGGALGIWGGYGVFLDTLHIQ